MKGYYYFLILNSYKNYILIKFEIYYKDNSIIMFNIPLYLSYLLQLLDIVLYLLLKCIYLKEIKLFIKALINYIIKLEFFITFKAIYFAIFIENNIRFKFNIFNLILYNLNKVINKLDICLRILIPNLLYPGIVSSYNL